MRMQAPSSPRKAPRPKPAPKCCSHCGRPSGKAQSGKQLRPVEDGITGVQHFCKGCFDELRQGHPGGRGGCGASRSPLGAAVAMWIYLVLRMDVIRAWSEVLPSCRPLFDKAVHMASLDRASEVKASGGGAPCSKQLVVSEDPCSASFRCRRWRASCPKGSLTAR